MGSRSAELGIVAGNDGEGEDVGPTDGVADLVGTNFDRHYEAGAEGRQRRWLDSADLLVSADGVVNDPLEGGMDENVR
jgi:hypothetical protein